MKDPRVIVKHFRMMIFPKILQEAIDNAMDAYRICNPLGETRTHIIVDHRLKWAGKLRDLYLNLVYKEYFMEDAPLEEKQQAIFIFDTEFSRMLEMIVIGLDGLGYKVEYKAPPQLTSPVSSAISVLGLMALDCKVSDPYILGSILER